MVIGDRHFVGPVDVGAFDLRDPLGWVAAQIGGVAPLDYGHRAAPDVQAVLLDPVNREAAYGGDRADQLIEGRVVVQVPDGVVDMLLERWLPRGPNLA